uniref:Uncharacterized protein n=1 Tax=Candidatus Kentrum sp. TC TaxID=2126339 RepID=A0A450Z4U9_9GAMM|nr:MAG: hypothetical protein BECKTC1821E_GA0114239_11349 [Candidatus Kentron sp. TC]VFK52229.1 MAG: hypothetical protein BECKTC1821D_GA0114238_11599 [Candidatus Kentron sp. TC]
MKKIIFLVLFILLMPVSASAWVKVVICDPESAANVTVSNDKGKWLGFSAKTKSGEIIDFEPHKLNYLTGIGTVADGNNYYFNNDNIVKVRASTWKNYNNSSELMEGRLSDTGWVSCE